MKLYIKVYGVDRRRQSRADLSRGRDQTPAHVGRGDVSVRVWVFEVRVHLLIFSIGSMIGINIGCIWVL